jgi:hypothetical protein
MSEEIQRRINMLDNKQVIHYLNVVANEVPTSFEETLDDLRKQASDISETLHPNFAANAEDAYMEGRDASDSARFLLHKVAESPGGAAIVSAAINQPPSFTADFGIVSGPVILLVAWLAVSGGIKIKIGGVEYEKDKLPSAKQIEIFKSLLPSLLKVL